MKITGHKTTAMFERYNTVDAAKTVIDCFRWRNSVGLVRT